MSGLFGGEPVAPWSTFAKTETAAGSADGGAFAAWRSRSRRCSRAATAICAILVEYHDGSSVRYRHDAAGNIVRVDATEADGSVRACRRRIQITCMSNTIPDWTA